MSVTIAPHLTAPQVEGAAAKKDLLNLRSVYLQRQADAEAQRAAISPGVTSAVDQGGGISAMNILLLAVGGYVIYKLL